MIMLKLNYEKIEEHKKELTQFKGWLPFRLDTFISLSERDDYLMSVGLFDLVQKRNAHYKYMLMNADNPGELEDQLLLDFVNENPQFKDIILQ